METPSEIPADAPAEPPDDEPQPGPESFWKFGLGDLLSLILVTGFSVFLWSRATPILGCGAPLLGAAIGLAILCWFARFARRGCNRRWELAMPEPVIQVENLTQHYGIRPVLRDINLEISAGELVAVIGPNGMGKTTLLAAIAGVHSPQKGSVTIAGLRRRSSPEAEPRDPAEGHLPARHGFPAVDDDSPRVLDLRRQNLQHRL